MPLDQRIHGKNGQVLMETEGSPAVDPIGDLNAWTLDLSTARVEVTAFLDTNVRRVAGLPDFSGTITGWWNAANVIYIDAVLAGNTPTLRLVPNSNDPDVYFQGTANIDGSVNLSATSAASMSGKWDAASNWVMRP